MTFTVPQLHAIKTRLFNLSVLQWVTITAVIISIGATYFSYSNDYIVRYGDAESHLNIAKRAIDSLTPGFAQLGGIWLPLPHLLLLPFVRFDFLWRTGLAGSIVSGVAFVITSAYLYRLAFHLTKNKTASVLASLVFMLNPNILYMQSTPMTELPLLAFFLLSMYYFLIFLDKDDYLPPLFLAAFFGLCATLSRYDGWFLVAAEAGIILLFYLPHKEKWKTMEGKLILFATVAFAGIAIWLLWDYLILGDPLYFTNSQYSAATQQKAFLAIGQLPSYHSLKNSLLYYGAAAMENAGSLLFAFGLLGSLWFLFSRFNLRRLYFVGLLGVPFAFYVLTLYMGQSVIFVPSLTPSNFHWNLFNVRYGLMAVPFIALFFGYLFYKSPKSIKVLLVAIFMAQTFMFLSGRAKVITFEDGITGLSSAKRPDAERFMAQNYDGGLVLMDDYARTVSIIRSNVPMKDLIYVGTKPYWQESLSQPEKYAKWIILQKDDEVWKSIFSNPRLEGDLYKFFQKVYTSDEILIFKRTADVAVN